MLIIRRTEFGRRLGCTFACLILAVSCVFALAAQGDTEASVKRIPLAEFKRLLAANAIVVVDVRSAESYTQGHIPGAISMPLDTVASRAGELGRLQKAIVTYCS